MGSVETVEELVAFGEKTGWPIVLKTPRGGYDGKGVRMIDDEPEARDAADWFGNGALLAEDKVDVHPRTFRAGGPHPVRRFQGLATWCTPSRSTASATRSSPRPRTSPPRSPTRPTQAALKIANDFGVTGVMAAELFETPGVGAGFVINELAMRPHNTGHWTMNGSITSQFEQHLRAVLDLPLGATDALAEIDRHEELPRRRQPGSVTPRSAPPWRPNRA